MRKGCETLKVKVMDKRIIDVFDPKDFKQDPEYSYELEYANFAIKRDDIVNTQRLKLKNKRRRIF